MNASRLRHSAASPSRAIPSCGRVTPVRNDDPSFTTNSDRITALYVMVSKVPRSAMPPICAVAHPSGNVEKRLKTGV